MVNNIDNNPNVFSQITGENNGKYVAYSYLNQDGTDPNANGSCCSWWCSDFASKLAQGFGGIGAAYVTAKYGNPKANNGNKTPATTPPTGGGTTPPAGGGTTPPMSLGKKVLIGGGIVGGIAVLITIIVVARKNKA